MLEICNDTPENQDEMVNEIHVVKMNKSIIMFLFSQTLF